MSVLLRRLRSPSAILVGSAVASRLGLLLMLAIAGRMLPGDAYQTVLVTTASAGAAQVAVGPPTFADYLVQHRMRFDQASAWWACLRVSIVSGVLVVLIALLVTITSGRGTGEDLEIATAVATIAGAELVVRQARWPWQAALNFRRYASFDLAIAGGRIVVAIVLLVDGSVAALTLGCLAVACGLLILLPDCRRPAKGLGERMTARRLVRETRALVGSASISASLSQAPNFVLGAVAPTAVAATYAVATRVTQAADLIPTALATTALPKLAATPDDEMRSAVRHQLVVATTMGTLVGCMTVASIPLVSVGFNYPVDSLIAPMIILALIMPVRFVNYQMFPVTQVLGLARERLRIITAVTVVAFALLFAGASSGTATRAAVVAFAAETLVLAGMATVVRRALRGAEAEEPASSSA